MAYYPSNVLPMEGVDSSPPSHIAGQIWNMEALIFPMVYDQRSYYERFELARQRKSTTTGASFALGTHSSMEIRSASS
jgi:hypothetical protein